MLKFDFNAEVKQVEKLCQEAQEILATRTEDEIKELIINFENFWKNEYQQHKKLTIAFIGQYNAGKSTLIKALTGDPKIRISAEICTNEVTAYSWQDVLLLDTPGINAGKTDSNHDEITIDIISKSDLLVFVVPNELFNPQGGKFFKQVAEEMQRVGQMLLVVNKMSRESGNTKDLLTTITKVIEPYHPSDFYTCFIDADCYLKSQDVKYAKYQQTLISKSNFDDFLNSLQRLVDKNQLSANLVTPLHRAIDMLDQAYTFLSISDHRTRDLSEILRRKSVLLRSSHTRVRNYYRSELNKFQNEIIMVGEGVVTKIDGHHSKEEIKSEIAEAEKKINLVSENTLENIQSLVKNELETLHHKLDEIQSSSIFRSLVEEFEINLVDGKTIDNPDIASKTLGSIRAGELLKGMGGLTSKVSRDVVYSIGKSIGVKFKPWGAVKTAKFIKGLGPIFTIGGVVLDVVMTAKQEQEEDDYKRKILQAKSEVRQEFRKVAVEIRKEYESQIEEGISFYEKELTDIECKQKELSNIEKYKVDVVSQIDNKRQEIKQKIKQLIK